MPHFGLPLRAPALRSARKQALNHQPEQSKKAALRDPVKQRRNRLWICVVPSDLNLFAREEARNETGRARTRPAA